MELDPIYLLKLAIPALIVVVSLVLRRDVDPARRAAWAVGAVGAFWAFFSIAGDHGQAAALFLLSPALAFGLLARRGGG